MNYVVGLLVFAPTEALSDSLHRLLPAKGRPLFEDEIAPHLTRVYTAIKTMPPPDSLDNRGSYFFLKWKYVEWSVSRYAGKLEDAGAICVFDYAVGELAADDEFIEENSPEQDECIFHLRVNRKMRRLDSSNFQRYLAGFPYDWSPDSETNARNITEFIVTTAYAGQ